MRIDIRFDDTEVRRGLDRLLRAAKDLSPAMREIAGHLGDSAQRSLERQAAPDGTPWKPLTKGAVDARRRRGKGPRPILELSGDLFGSIQTEHDARSATAGTGLVYAAIHQFGGTPGMRPASAAIPARPFLGVDDDHRDMILETVRDHLLAAVRRR